MIGRLLAILRARNLEFLRDRSSLGWNILLPILLVAGLAAVFSGGERPLFKVGVLGDVPGHAVAAAPTLPLAGSPGIQLVAQRDAARARKRVSRQQLDLLLDPVNGRYWINPQSTKGALLERLLHTSGIADPEKPTAWQRLESDGAQIRYIDWLVPGILGMNMMFSCLFGVGFVVVRYRKNGFLKRLSATPLRAIEFVGAQLASRLVLIMVITCAVYVGTDFFLQFRMEGSYWLLFVIALLGAASMVALSLAITARITSEELAGGLLNLTSWPMMVLSGVWFSMEGMNPVLRNLAKAFPLTQMLDAARSVMLDGGGLDQVWPHLVVLCAMTALFLAVGAYFFRWRSG